MEQDLTAGSVPAQLIRFSLPLLAANLLQSFYNLVDMAVVGRFVGKDGLAAVSSAVLLCYIISALCSGVTMGGGVLCAQYTGAGDRAALRETVGTLFTVSSLCSLGVTLLGLLVYRPVFILMNVPPEALPHALAYMPVICWGTVFVFGYNAVCAVLRGLGDSKSPLLFVGTASLVNIGLDFLLVGGLGMGAAGAAWATVASQAVSFLLSLVFLRRRGFFAGFTPASFRVGRDKAALILRIGLPSAIQMGVLNLSYLLVTGMLNSYGVVVAAAAGVGLKVNTFAAMPCWAVGAGVTTMAGQCVGAGDAERAVKTAKTGVALAVGVSAVMVALVFLFAGSIVSLFDGDCAVVAEGARYLRICCCLNCLVYAAMYIYDSFATGVGAAWLAMVNSLLQSLVFRLLFSLLLERGLGLGRLGLYWAECLSPIVPAVIGGVFFYSGYWRRHRLLPR